MSSKASSPRPSRPQASTLTTPFVQMTYDDAIRSYGIDKPDMRLPSMVELTEELTPELRTALKIEHDLPVLGFIIPKVGELSGTARKALLSEIRAGFGDCGLDFLDVARLKTNADFVPLAENIAARLADNIGQEWLNGDDLVVVITPEARHACRSGTTIRSGSTSASALSACSSRRSTPTSTASSTKTGNEADYKFLWVTDFPMYEWDEEAKTWNAAHHPFTSPHEEDIKAGRLTNDKGAVRALAYDIVLNGTELGSGSIRIHRQDVQAEIFRSLGMTDEEAKERFGFFLDALEYGTPPHGGIALGLDRIVMILAGATSLREVIAFPKTAKAIDLMVDAPTPVSEQQMRELSLRTVVRS